MNIRLAFKNIFLDGHCKYWEGCCKYKAPLDHHLPPVSK